MHSDLYTLHVMAAYATVFDFCSACQKRLTGIEAYIVLEEIF